MYDEDKDDDEDEDDDDNDVCFQKCTLKSYC